MTTSSRADTTRGMEFLYSLRRLKGRAVPTDVRLSPRGVTEAVRARVPSAEYAIPLCSGARKRQVVGVRGFALFLQSRSVSE